MRVYGGVGVVLQGQAVFFPNKQQQQKKNVILLLKDETMLSSQESK